MRISHSIRLLMCVETGHVAEWDVEDQQWRMAYPRKTIWDVMHEINPKAKSYDGTSDCTDNHVYQIKGLGDEYYEGGSLGWLVREYEVSWTTEITI